MNSAAAWADPDDDDALADIAPPPAEAVYDRRRQGLPQLQGAAASAPPRPRSPDRPEPRGLRNLSGRHQPPNPGQPRAEEEGPLMKTERELLKETLSVLGMPCRCNMTRRCDPCQVRTQIRAYLDVADRKVQSTPLRSVP